MDKFFKISERGSSLKVEILAGLTTFFAMCYIVFVNPAQVAAGGANGWLVGAGADPAVMGAIWNAVYVASILVAVIGTMLMALYAKLPFAQACGMGLNSFFCTTFISGAHFAGADIKTSYQAGLVIVFLSGIIFLILSVTGARSYIAKSMPECLKKSIPAGIGLFITFIGFQNAGIITANPYTLTQFVQIHDAEWSTYAPALVALIGFLIICILSWYKIPGSVIIGILASTVLYYIFTGTAPSFDFSNIGQSFKDFTSIGLFGVFNPAAWSTAFTAEHIGGVFSAIILVISFCLVDMFDTIGTLYGTASEAGMLDENGDPVDVNKAMTCDSVGTVAGSLLGTSTCTTFVESASGVAAGGRTGLTSLVVAACFFVCLFLSPLASVIPSAATAPALIFVGVLMLKNFSSVDMSDIASAAPAFITLVMMVLTYSISNGIGLGAATYVVITACTGKYTKKDIVVTVIAILFIFKFMFVTM